jgi:hypothetical protein
VLGVAQVASLRVVLRVVLVASLRVVLVALGALLGTLLGVMFGALLDVMFGALLGTLYGALQRAHALVIERPLYHVEQHSRVAPLDRFDNLAISTQHNGRHAADLEGLAEFWCIVHVDVQHVH